MKFKFSSLNDFKNYPSKYYTTIIFICCILFIFSNIALYSLIDIDETRYVNMSKYMYLSKEYITPILNFEPFLEKPPLYFWLNVLSYKVFGNFSLFASRFQIALLSSLSVFFTYFFLIKTTKKPFFSLISSLVLLSSCWFLIFSHVAILDLGFMFFSMCAIYCAVIPLFLNICDDNNKNKSDYKKLQKEKIIFWYLGYFFMALSILAKGFIGLIIPCGVVFFSYLINKKTKELFKPIYLLPGVLILLFVALPWHILIYKAHGEAWVNMYILKHHFARLLNSQGLGRKQPFLFYVPIILVGLIPWWINFIALITKAIKNTMLFKGKNIFNAIKQEKIIAFAYIYFLFVFLFFSISSTKLPTYILTLFPALAIIIGGFWCSAIENKVDGVNETNEKYLTASNYINSSLFLLVSFLLIILCFIYKLPAVNNIAHINLSTYIAGALKFALPSLIIVFIVSLLIFIYTKKKEYIKSFVSNLILSLLIVHIGFDFIIPYYMSFSQDELVNFSEYIYSKENSKLITYDMATKYSILNPYKKVKYIVKKDPNKYSILNDYINNSEGSFYIITRNKNNDLDNNSKFKKIKQGKAYKVFVYKDI